MLATSLRRGFAIVVSTLAAGCSSPSQVAAAPSPLGPLKPLAPPTTPFVPPAANGARKAKLIALAPKLDELFRTRLGEVGATGAASPSAHVSSTPRGGTMARVRRPSV